MLQPSAYDLLGAQMAATVRMEGEVSKLNSRERKDSHFPMLSRRQDYLRQIIWKRDSVHLLSS